MLRLKTFGGLSLLSAETPLSGAASRRRSLALLTLVASAGEQGISDEHALALLWPDFDSARGRNNLKQVVFALRQAVAPNVFVRNSTTLRVDSSIISADLWDFERAAAEGDAARAVATHTGPFLDGFLLPDLIDFQRWVEKERARLRHLYADALKVLALSADHAGDRESALSLWRKLVTEDPLSEQFAQNLIRALAESGDIAGALQHAHIHENLLQQELELKPGIAFQRLVQEIREARHSPHGFTSRKSRAVTPSVGAPAQTSTAPAVTLPTMDDIAPPVTESSAAATEAVAEPNGIGSAPDVRADGPPPRRVWTGKERRIFRFAPRVAMAAAALLIAAVVDLPSSRTTQAAGTAWANRGAVVVLPFATDSDAEDLGATITKLLATSLDGSLGLRVVSLDGGGAQADSLRGRSLLTNRSLARRLAERIEARIYLSGEVVRNGDRLRIAVELLDRALDDPIERAVAEGTLSELFTLVDRVASQILASRFEGGRRDVVRVASVTTASFAAAKAYFAAEDDFRAGRFLRAIDSYEEAIDADSTFALAYYGLSGAADVFGDDALAAWSADEALRHASRLPGRQRRLLSAYVARQRGDVDEAERMYARLTSDYPADAEAWLGLAETLFHFNPLRGRPAAEAKAAFDRVTVIDPQNTSALVHLARIATLEGETLLAARVVARARTLSSNEALGHFAVHVLSLGGDGVEVALMAREGGRETATPAALAAIELLTSAETQVWRRFAMQFASRDASADMRAYGLQLRSLIDAGQGRIANALALLDTCSASDRDLAVETRSRLAALPFIPLDSIALGRVRDELLGWQPDAQEMRNASDSTAHTGAPSYVQLHRLGLLAIRVGDTVTAARLVKELDDRAQRSPKESGGRWFATSLRARLLASHGRTAEALTLMESADGRPGASASAVEALDRLLYAQLLEKKGRGDEALAYYEQFGWSSPIEFPLVWQAELGMARIHAKRGDRALAARYYRSVAELLRDADSTLQATRNDAAQWAARLTK